MNAINLETGVTATGLHDLVTLVDMFLEEKRRVTVQRHMEELRVEGDTSSIGGKRWAGVRLGVDA
ncbi:MAG: hypothetical protein H6644_01120 [Caldilineaceae bacterium]|nr:hypothetical protein [Caldilineaceae bacterium]